MRKYVFAVLLLAVFIPSVQAQTSNLLVNPSFEGVYYDQDNIDQIKVANGWRAFWKQDLLAMPDWALSGNDHRYVKRPEYKPLSLSIDAGRVRSGQLSQCLFATYGVLIAGVQQTVSIKEGAWYQASAYVQSWSSTKGDPTKNEGGDMYAVVGIDPYGGTSPWSRRVLWGDWVYVPPKGETAQFALTSSPVVQARSDRVTVFILGDGRWATVHNDLYIDDANLVEVSLGVTPVPTPVPAPPGECDYDVFRGIIREELSKLELRYNAN